MVKLNDRMVDGGMDLLKLSNRFVQVPESDLTQERLFSLNYRRGVKNQNHRIVNKGARGLFFGCQMQGFCSLWRCDLACRNNGIGLGYCAYPFFL